MNYWYEYLLAFLLGLTGCLIASIILDQLLPLELLPYIYWRN